MDTSGVFKKIIDECPEAFPSATETKDVWHMPVVVNYDGPPPTVVEMPSGGSVWRPGDGALYGRRRETVGRKSRRTARLTARYFRAAAKREAKP